MSETLCHWINGRPLAGQSGRLGDVFNPAIGEKIAEVPFASVGEVDLAVAAASAAAPEWAATPPIRRARVIFKFKELIEARMALLARTQAGSLSVFGLGVQLGKLDPAEDADRQLDLFSSHR